MRWRTGLSSIMSGGFDADEPAILAGPGAPSSGPVPRSTDSRRDRANPRQRLTTQGNPGGTPLLPPGRSGAARYRTSNSPTSTVSDCCFRRRVTRWSCWREVPKPVLSHSCRVVAPVTSC